MKEKEIHLRDYLRIVNKRKITILTFFILTLLIVIIATFTVTPMYQASTKVIIEKNTAGVLTSSSYTPYDPEFLETQYQLIKSAVVVEKVVKKLDADKIYDLFFTKKKEEKSYLATAKDWVKEQISSLKLMAGIDTFFSPRETDENNSPLEMRIPSPKPSS